MIFMQSHQKISIRLNTFLSKITALLFLTLFIFANQAISQSFERGMDAADVGDFTTALKEWKPLAENGHAMAQLSLGFLYLDDEDVPADYDEAEKWLKKAAEQGLMEAQFTLGSVYYGNYGDGFEKDIEQSFFYFSLAAEQGFAPAQFYLGFMYQDEFVEPWDLLEAQKWYIRAAEQGFTPAKTTLGKLLQKEGWLADDLKMQEVGLMWSVIAMLQGDNSAEFDVRVGEGRLSEESIARVRILVDDCFEKNFVGCEN